MAELSAYDLMVLLDPETPEERRTELIDQIKQQIDRGGATLKGESDWGMRRLAFEIDHRGEAQYHLFQFEAGAEVLNELDRTLSIDDAVLRHRIIRLPGPAPDSPPRPSADEGFRRSDERGGRGPRGSDARRGEPGGEARGEVAEEQAAPPEGGEAAAREGEPPAEATTPAAPAPAETAATTPAAPPPAETAAAQPAEAEAAPPSQPTEDGAGAEERETS